MREVVAVTDSVADAENDADVEMKETDTELDLGEVSGVLLKSKRTSKIAEILSKRRNANDSSATDTLSTADNYFAVDTYFTADNYFAADTYFTADADVEAKKTDADRPACDLALGDGFAQMLKRRRSGHLNRQHEQGDCKDAVPGAKREHKIDLDEWRVVATELMNKRFVTESGK
ncbi:hypothetical protein ACHAPU_009048 [Fusarium lateritium]